MGSARRPARVAGLLYSWLRGRAIGVAQQCGHDVVGAAAASLCETLQPTRVFAFHTEEDPQLRLGVTLPPLHVVRVDRLKHGVEVARLRIVGCPGIGIHGYVPSRLRSAFDE